MESKLYTFSTSPLLSLTFPALYRGGNITYLDMQVEAGGSFKMIVFIYQSARLRIPEDTHLQTPLCP
jgi:hypothetical protein